MKNKIIIFALLLVTNVGIAQKWTPQTGAIKFRLTMLGLGVNGSLSGLKANVDFNPEKPESGSIFATVDANTVFTDNSLRDSHLKEKPEFFEPAKYPVLTLKSTKISKAGESFVGDFNLTIKNVTKSVKVPFKLVKTDKKGTFTAKFEISRKDFNFGGSTVGMSDKVTINLVLNAVEQ